jgi:antirestriction protein ArdC
MTGEKFDVYSHVTNQIIAQIGVEPEFDQSAAYVEGWLEAMKEDSRAIFRAASEAQKAVDYIMTRTAQADRMAAE